MITALAAAKAYAANQSSSIGGIGGGDKASGMSFGDVLSDVMNDTVHATKQAESKIAQGVAGKADMIDVVTAISSAESSLETVMAVRDQVISAYQEIMRMPI
ncbi:MAG: flagellar hook-basal body complex protein FliE [Caulobacterales bacterium 68-7]|nr:flagellar hook-basal body complex protein FliE [Caulobacterales bacterium]OJU13911.1 MAG: flagellar hook-basal body complex protein FliE [Caulobacterales bacterium 68-7]